MLKNSIATLMVFFLVFLNAVLTFAQDGQGEMKGMQGGSCPMCGAMGWGGMVLGGLLFLAVIGVLVSLSVFLVRRSRI